MKLRNFITVAVATMFVSVTVDAASLLPITGPIPADKFIPLRPDGVDLGDYVDVYIIRADDDTQAPSWMPRRALFTFNAKEGDHQPCMHVYRHEDQKLSLTEKFLTIDAAIAEFFIRGKITTLKQCASEREKLYNGWISDLTIIKSGGDEQPEVNFTFGGAHPTRQAIHVKVKELARSAPKSDDPLRFIDALQLPDGEQWTDFHLDLLKGMVYRTLTTRVIIR